CAQAGAAGLLQTAGRTDDQVVLGRHTGQVTQQMDLAIVPRRKVQGVAVVEKLEQGLQQVVAIRPAPDNVQEQVQLGGGGQAQGQSCQSASRGSQRVMTKVSSTLCPDSCRRWGRVRPPTCW